MLYSKLVTLFSGGASFAEDEVPFGDNFVVRNFSFHSPTHQRGGLVYSQTPASATGSEVDEEIQENNNFRYHVMMPAQMEKAHTVGRIRGRSDRSRRCSFPPRISYEPRPGQVGRSATYGAPEPRAEAYPANAHQFQLCQCGH